MCFSVPYRVLSLKGNDARIEGGRRVRFGNDTKIKIGDYVQVEGNVIVASIPKPEGDKVRQLIARLNS